MTILQTFSQIPVMLYASLLLFPVAFYGYFAASKPKGSISARIADPADQLKEKKIDVGRETASGVFLGVTIALGAAAVLLVGGVVADYKDSRGIFAVILPQAAIPAAPSYVYPPAPSIDDKGGIVGKNSVINTTKPKGGFLQ